ncbi:MAG: hypothetical protein IT210_21625 [Armatimonadetes bacterium]|nr:hypothetical protein [Armatimonadota bacterium]
MIPWLVQPHRTEPKILEWAERYSERAYLDIVRLRNHTAYALTVTDRSRPDEAKKKSLFAVPHAHEPAGTAACMNILGELLDGCDLAGNPTALDREAMLASTLLTFIPDANPEGRSRAPVEMWDGSRFTNDEFLKYAFGIDGATGERFKRVDRWSAREERPSRIGIVYERIDETTYVEPNRDWGSSFFRLAHRLMDRWPYDQFIDLHQTEFENSPYNCMIILPVSWRTLPEPICAYSRAWADDITRAWGEMDGASPHQPEVLGYTGQQRAYFEERWGRLHSLCPIITTEIQNNNPRTPPDLQRQLQETALRISIERISASA